MEPRQPLRTSFSRRRTLALVAAPENQFGRYSFDLFLQEQAQRRHVGDRLGNREVCLWPEARSRERLHHLVHVRAVFGINLANQVRPQSNFERAALRAPPLEDLYSDLP